MSSNQGPGSPWDPNNNQQNWGQGGQNWDPNGQNWNQQSPQSWGSANQPPQQPPQSWGSANQPPQQNWDQQGQNQNWNQPQPPYDGSTQTWPASDPNSPNTGNWNGQQPWAGQAGPAGPGNQNGSGGSRKGIGIGIAIVAVVLVAAIGLAFFLVNRNKNNDTQAGGGSTASSSASSSADETSTAPITIVDDPQAAIKDYFDAVMKGDPKRALSYGRNSPSGSSKYLTAEMMKAAQKKNPISGLTVETGSTSDYSASVNVSYDIGSESVTSTYSMSRQGKGSHWQMMQAAADVDLSRIGGDEITINGTKVKATKIALFPGGYTFESGNEYVQYGNDDSTLYIKEPSSYVSTYNMAPALTTKGVSTWRSLVKQSLSTCLASHKIKPAGCPFYSPDTTTSGASVVEDSVNYTSSSSSSIDTATPRLTDGTMQATGYVYLYVKATAKAKDDSGDIGSVGGSATTTSSKPTVDFSAAKPTVTWPTS